MTLRELCKTLQSPTRVKVVSSYNGHLLMYNSQEIKYLNKFGDLAIRSMFVTFDPVAAQRDFVALPILVCKCDQEEFKKLRGY